MSKLELSRVKASSTGKFLIARTKQNTGVYQASCEEYVEMLRQKQADGTYKKFGIECFECKGASMAECEQKYY